MRTKTFTVMLTGSIVFERCLDVEAANQEEAIRLAMTPDYASGTWHSASNSTKPMSAFLSDVQVRDIWHAAPTPRVVEVEDPAEASVRLAGTIIADALLKPVEDWAAEEPCAKVGYVARAVEAENKAAAIALALAGVKPLPEDFATTHPDVVAAIRTILDARDGKAV